MLYSSFKLLGTHGDSGDSLIRLACDHRYLRLAELILVRTAVTDQGESARRQLLRQSFSGRYLARIV